LRIKEVTIAIIVYFNCTISRMAFFNIIAWDVSMLMRKPHQPG
jgi:hypothetical protein